MRTYSQMAVCGIIGVMLTLTWHGQPGYADEGSADQIRSRAEMASPAEPSNESPRYFGRKATFDKGCRKKLILQLEAIDIEREGMPDGKSEYGRPLLTADPSVGDFLNDSCLGPVANEKLEEIQLEAKCRSQLLAKLRAQNRSPVWTVGTLFTGTCLEVALEPASASQAPKKGAPR